MALFEKEFTNIFWDGEVSGRTPDAQGDYYLVTDAQADHEYLQEKLVDTISAISGKPTETFLILYGGRVSDSGSGQIDITEGIIRTLDTNGEKRFVHIPALNNVSIPSGWNDGRSIWVTARYDFKLGASTRNHKAGPSYHYQILDTYMGDSNGYISTTTDDLFASSDPVATAAILGKFTMTGTTFVDLNVRSPEFPIIDPSYDYVVDSQGKFDLMVANATWFNAKNLLFTTNVTRAAETTIPSTVEKIHAINGATLTASSLTSAQSGLKYASIPTDNKYEIKGLRVVATGTGIVYGITNCLNLTDCNATATGASSYAARGFSTCNNLTNCVGTGNTSGNGSGYGFYTCINLNNCTGTAVATTSGAAYGFYDCSHIYKCTGNATSANTGYHSYGFYQCEYLVNCITNPTPSGTGTAYGFYTCYYVTNSEVTITHGNTGGVSGFAACHYITNCVMDITGTGTTGSSGMSSCSNITNCKATARDGASGLASGFSSCDFLTNCVGVTTSTAATGYGFTSCDHLTNCQGRGLGSSTGYGYNGCRWSNGCADNGYSSTTALWGGSNTFRDDDSCELT
jgi:hypothetical protein